jgi:sensor c-di-GMP phosphodiesterase-like protein
MVNPVLFIPMAERQGPIGAIGKRVIDSATGGVGPVGRRAPAAAGGENFRASRFLDALPAEE